MKGAFEVGRKLRPKRIDKRKWALHGKELLAWQQTVELELQAVEARLDLIDSDIWERFSGELFARAAHGNHQR